MVLRGVNRSGMEYTDRNSLDPTGRTRPSSREGAGITRAEIREIVGHWGANIIRLPINQEWTLTRADYLVNLDSIIEWAAAEGAYTLLDLQWFDNHREFGRDAHNNINRVPPMPEENSVRLWRLLASRYRDEPAVLYDIFNEPHEALANDTSFLFQRPGSRNAWISMWHDWVRRLTREIHAVNGRALIFVSGWDWALDLRGFPVQVARKPLANVVYSTHVYPDKAANTADFDNWFGFPRLRNSHPVFVGEWGGGALHLDWGNRLEGYLRDKHRYTGGVWPGVAGWTAWSWSDAAQGNPPGQPPPPPLVERGQGSRTVRGRTFTWRTFVMAGGHYQPTEFGELVRGALRTMPLAPTADFDATRPVGSRNRYRISISTARHGDFFVVNGHDFTPGTRIIFSGLPGSVTVRPRMVLPHLLIVPQLPTAVPLGNGMVHVLRPDGVQSELTPCVVTGAQAAQTTINPGASKAAPFTIVLIANPVVERRNGTLVADPIQTRRLSFHRVVADVIRSLFGRSETLLHPFLYDIRIVARFAPDTGTLAHALCKQSAGGVMEPVQDRITNYLASLGISADICYVVYQSTRYTRESSLCTDDDVSIPGKVFLYDGAAHWHRRTCTSPGVICQNVPMDDPATPLHEFMHAAGAWGQGEVA